MTNWEKLYNRVRRMQEGMMYEVREEKKRKVKWFDKGYIGAMNAIAYLMENPDEIEKDLEKAPWEK